MAKASLTLGFAVQAETAPDVYTADIYERPDYPADVLQEQKQWKPGESTNDTLDISNKFSVVIDDYLMVNLAQLRYVLYGGVKWKVRTLNPKRPRIDISVGGVYNEET
jgi:hypothetical protein